MIHQSVLLHESIDGLHIEEGDIFIDATINGAGHSEEVAKKFGNKVKIIGFDMDADALLRAEERLKKANADFKLIQSNFRNMKTEISKIGVTKVKRVLFDLGISSNQYEDTDRGFSFQKDEPLLMTFRKDPSESDLTAQKILNEWDEEHIADVIYAYGEERYSRRIAKKIVETRERYPIKSTFDLVEVIRQATPFFYHHSKTHFATRTFQALRIAVNDEMYALKDGLEAAYQILTEGGRIAVISFQSIEDRIVKQFFKKKAQEGTVILVNKKPLTPSVEEVKANRRARSAKLRIIEKKL